MAKTLTLPPDKRFATPVEALIETSILKAGRPMLAGWLVPQPDFPTPHRVALRVGETAVDIGRVIPPQAESPPPRPEAERFRVNGPHAWPPAGLTGKPGGLVLLAASGAWVPLPMAPRLPALLLDYHDEREFIRHVQSPSNRAPDKEAMAFHARQYLLANPDKPILAAGALTILGYRVLDNSWTDPDGGSFCLARAEPVLEALSDPQDERSLRWFISLSLVCHYLQISRGDKVSGLARLRRVWELRERVTISPAQGTNLLKATFHLGSGLWRQGMQPLAEEVLTSAKDTFRTAASLWTFDNYHSGSELVVMANLVRACLVWLERERFAATGAYSHPSYAAAPSDVSELRSLGFPTLQLMQKGLI